MPKLPKRTRPRVHPKVAQSRARRLAVASGVTTPLKPRMANVPRAQKKRDVYSGGGPGSLGAIYESRKHWTETERKIKQAKRKKP